MRYIAVTIREDSSKAAVGHVFSFPTCISWSKRSVACGTPRLASRSCHDESSTRSRHLASTSACTEGKAWWTPWKSETYAKV